jgi:hypothetical protein
MITLILSESNGWDSFYEINGLKSVINFYFGKTKKVRPDDVLPLKIAHPRCLLLLHVFKNSLTDKMYKKLSRLNIYLVTPLDLQLMLSVLIKFKEFASCLFQEMKIYFYFFIRISKDEDRTGKMSQRLLRRINFSDISSDEIRSLVERHLVKYP